jgi:SAM-dependent methyltransferase
MARMINQRENSPLPVNAPIADALSYDQVLERLSLKYERAFPIWLKLLKAAMQAYLDAPDANLSVEGSINADCFGNFVASYIKGRVLDIGCGIAKLPWYLRNYPLGSIAGLDPEVAPEEHPFLFVQGIAEYIPWEDHSFETVIIATSLDHVLSLKESLSEIKRVLSKEGHCIVWVGFIPGSQPYDPFAPDLTALDEYHLFHFDKQWFEELMKEYFICLEKVDVDGVSYFYAFTPR